MSASVQRAIMLLTASNCFKYVEAELLAWISAWPWLNIEHITKPSENISLNIEQLENSWISGAIRNQNRVAKREKKWKKEHVISRNVYDK